jgi:DNA-binding response OmpR family regulator
MSLPVPKVAVVSEDPELAEVCARMLRQEGYAVKTAQHSGHAVLACLEGGPVDLLIAELSMDDGSGPSLARRMRRYNPNLKAIYIAKEGTSCATDAVLVRPFTRDDLLKRLEVLPEIDEPTEDDPSTYF